MKRKLRTARLVGSLLLLSLFASQASAQTADQHKRTINKLGRNVLCVCQDASPARGFAGTIRIETYVLPGGLPLQCAVPTFDWNGDPAGVFLCAVYDVVN